MKNVVLKTQNFDILYRSYYQTNYLENFNLKKIFFWEREITYRIFGAMPCMENVVFETQNFDILYRSYYTERI